MEENSENESKKRKRSESPATSEDATDDDDGEDELLDLEMIRSENVLPSYARRTEKGGYAHTSSSRRKIGDANRGNIPWNKGKNRSAESKAKISMAVRARNQAILEVNLKKVGLSQEEYENIRLELKYLRERVRKHRLARVERRKTQKKQKEALEKYLKYKDDEEEEEEEEEEEGYQGIENAHFVEIEDNELLHEEEEMEVEDDGEIQEVLTSQLDENSTQNQRKPNAVIATDDSELCISNFMDGTVQEADQNHIHHFDSFDVTKETALPSAALATTENGALNIIQQSTKGTETAAVPLLDSHDSTDISKSLQPSTMKRPELSEELISHSQEKPETGVPVEIVGTDGNVTKDNNASSGTDGNAAKDKITNDAVAEGNATGRILVTTKLSGSSAQRMYLPPVFRRDVHWHNNYSDDADADRSSYEQFCPNGGPGGLICCSHCSSLYSDFLLETQQNLEDQQISRVKKEVCQISDFLTQTTARLKKSISAANKNPPPCAVSRQQERAQETQIK